MSKTNRLIVALILALIPAAVSAQPKEPAGMKEKVRLITLDPGHFHAALVQKQMNDAIDPVVHVYAPAGEDLQQHIARIESFNSRAEQPTHWELKVHAQPDFFEQMIKDRPGNVVVISGNNSRKTEYIAGAIDAGLNVLADKPMAINPDHLQRLIGAFETAKKKGVLLYDVMPERYEITNTLQRELSRVEEVFGTLVKGTVEEPAITKESVHHFFKQVAGSPLKRPAWFFDVTQEGEGIVDVTTHLVDLVQWGAFPEQIIRPESDIKMLAARHWATTLTPEQFKKVTGQSEFPEFLKKDVKDSLLHVMGNGEFTYLIKGSVAKVSVRWNFEAPPGTADTHNSIMRGSKANLIIKQGAEQKYKATLYVENIAGIDDADFEKTLRSAIAKIAEMYPGVDVQKSGKAWEVNIPDRYNVGHEAHFTQVAQKYLEFLAAGKMPEWEEPNMIAKYYTIMQAYKMSREPSAAASGVSWDHQKGSHLSMMLDGKTLWTYHYATKDNVPYFHPVNLPSGPTLTNFAPKDHPWHRALWFSWKTINGVNYWEWAQPKKPGATELDPDGVPAGWTRFSGNETVQTNPDGARISMEIDYGTGDALLLKEERRIIAEAPRADGSYVIDWYMTFTAQDQELTFDRTPPNKTGGGYAGLSYRAPDSIKQVRVIDSEGRSGMDARGPASRWIDASGVIDPQFGASGLTIICHPANERYPSPWHLWAREGGVYLNPSMLFAEPYKLLPGKSFTLKYRILVHKGPGDPAAIEKEFADFQHTK
ncbi:MAG: PmoA family protein [Rhizobiales bacterium]|nr:PmoA family protein [Hyphomicrobiales bacterium]